MRDVARLATNACIGNGRSMSLRCSARSNSRWYDGRTITPTFVDRCVPDQNPPVVRSSDADTILLWSVSTSRLYSVQLYCPT